MLDLFYPAKIVKRPPDVFHSVEHGKMTAEDKRRRDAKAANNLKQYLKRKAGP